MSTAQKRGFRLPWSSDRGLEDAGEDARRLAAFLDAASEAEAPPSGPEALGDGPFGPIGGDGEPDTGEVAGPDSGSPSGAAQQESEAVVLESVVDGRSGAPATTDKQNPESTEPVKAAWPEIDRRESPAHHADDPPPAPAAPRPARRDNPLVAGLVRAMRQAAEASRAESITALREEAAAHVEAIRGGSTAEAAALRKRADEDIAGIREWAKAEIARIRQESEQRVADRRESNARELDAHAAAIEGQIAEVETAIAAYEAEMEQFFKVLMSEEDPARLATLAERAPEPPILAELPSVQRAAVAIADAEADELSAAEADELSAAEAAEPPAAEAAEPAEDVGLAPEDAAVAEAEAIEGLAVDGSATVWDASSEATEPEAEREAAPATAADPEASRVVVTGLTTVATISMFKGRLSSITGVHAVGVTAGDRGSFVFAVQHDRSVALRDEVATMPGFNIAVTGDEGSTIHATVQEAAA